MLFLNEKEKSLGPKLLITVALLFSIIGSVRFIFTLNNNDVSSAEELLGIGISYHQALLIFCAIIYFLRVMITMLVFVKRKLVWIESIMVSFLMYFVIGYLLRNGAVANRSIDIVVTFGFALFVFGSWLNTYSEYSRHIWKNKTKNQGRIYTEGLFHYSIHINYFGDIIQFTGFVIISSYELLIIPLVMTLNFVALIIPRLDRYLEEKYGQEFIEYATRTKKFIPFVY